MKDSGSAACSARERARTPICAVPHTPKKRPANWRASYCSRAVLRLRGLLNARRGGALGAFLGLVAHLGALGQGLEALAQDRAVMDEDVLRAVIGSDEPVALVVAEPLDCSSRHLLPPLVVLRTRRLR